MKSVILYGGSFDPPHIGHVESARFVYDSLYKLFDDLELWILPCYSNKFDAKDITATTQQRLDMLRLAFPDYPICTEEIDRANECGTYSTVMNLRKRFPNTDFMLMMGTDQAVNIRKWRNARRLLRGVSLIVVDREKYAYKKIGMHANVLRIAKPPALRMLGYISSTSIRNKIRNNTPDKFVMLNTRIVNESVALYIEENNLYK